MEFTLGVLFLVLVNAPSAGALRLPSQTNLTRKIEVEKDKSKLGVYVNNDCSCYDDPCGDAFFDQNDGKCWSTCWDSGWQWPCGDCSCYDDPCGDAFFDHNDGKCWSTCWQSGWEWPCGGSTTTSPSSQQNTGAHGDPHMTNAYGERFDIFREGLADLLIIRDGKDVLLKIQAMIKRTLPLCNGRFVCNFGLFMTEVTLSGRWVKRKFHLGIEKAQNKEEPSVLVDGTEVWPLSTENSIFSELNLKVSNFSASDQGLRFDFMKAKLDVRRIIENYAACKKDSKRKVKFFNVYFQGTKELISEGMTVGGILGNDPRHEWEKCDISDAFDLANGEKEMNFGFAKVD